MSDLNNPTAFPFMEVDHFGQNYQQHWGLTMRDYFAAKAMQARCAQPSDAYYTVHDCARFAYEQADAMLAERAK